MPVPGGITVQDEGVGIANNPHGTMNFVGAGVTATDVAGVATVTVQWGVVTQVQVMGQWMGPWDGSSDYAVGDTVAELSSGL